MIARSPVRGTPWRRAVVSASFDAGCGTGTSTATLLTATPEAEIAAIDASAKMLGHAQAKRRPPSVRFVHTPVKELAEAGVRGPFDGIFVACLIRNLEDPDQAVREFRDLLRPGATLAVHESSVRDSRWTRVVWHAVCHGVIIPAGWLLTGDAALYRYLGGSVDGFDGAARFRRRLREAGFTGVHSETLPGWQHGIVRTFLASRPPEAAR